MATLDRSQFFRIQPKLQVINHKNQSFSARKMLQNVRSLSIQECPDQNDFELQLLNQKHTQNSSKLIPSSKKHFN